MRKKTMAQKLSESLGGEWKAVRDGFGWYWVGPDGREVRTYAESVMDHNGYSDTEFYRVYIDNHGVRVGSEGIVY